MKKFNGSILALFAMLLNTATTNALEWPSWARWNTQNQDRTWTQYGIQKGKAIWLGIKNHPKITGTVVGIGGLALAYKYRKQLWANRPRLFRPDPQTDQDQIINDINQYWILYRNSNTESVKEENRLRTKLSNAYENYKNIRNPNTIEAETLKSLGIWYSRYLDNKSNRSKAEEAELQYLEKIS